MEKSLFILTLVFCSCTWLNRGYVNEHNQYVPKNPKYKLKDKPGLVMPENLDTVNIYRLEKMYYEGRQAYPYLPTDNRYNDPRYALGVIFMKFYSHGRLLSFSIPDSNRLKKEYGLQNEDLQPDKPGYSKDYYFSKDGKNIQVESFVYGEGDGRYLILPYRLSDSGDTLVMNQNRSTRIYVKQKIPPHWKKYPVNW